MIAPMSISSVTLPDNGQTLGCVMSWRLMQHGAFLDGLIRHDAALSEASRGHHGLPRMHWRKKSRSDLAQKGVRRASERSQGGPSAPGYAFFVRARRMIRFAALLSAGTICSFVGNIGRGATPGWCTSFRNMMAL